MVVIEAGQLPPGEVFLISNYGHDDERSRLAAVPSLVDPQVSLPNSKLRLRLYDGPPESASVIDLIDDGRGAPFGGQSGETKAAMVRTDLAGPGDEKESWTTATEASGWDPGATELGTPGTQPGQRARRESPRTSRPSAGGPSRASEGRRPAPFVSSLARRPPRRRHRAAAGPHTFPESPLPRPLALLYAALLLVGHGCGRSTEGPQPEHPPGAFTAVTAASGIDFVHRSGADGRYAYPETFGAGAAWVDYDGDGWLDLYLGPGGEPSRPRRDRRRGTQPALPEPRRGGRLQAAFPRRHRGHRGRRDGYGMGTAAADVDGDGAVDCS